MNHTPNYNLSQWEAEDKVLRTDFNADNAKIDAGLKALNTGKADKSTVTALQSQVNTVKTSVPKIVMGTYTGNGAASQTIPLPFAPKAVLVISHDGYTRNTARIFGGLALPGSPAKIDHETLDLTAVSISGNGFRVFSDTSDEYWTVVANSKDFSYHYLAIG
ncbi:MAG: hypothetical protein HFF52_03925 [Lawsonibacter sp.]|nr:hypothetical protein [Lawsonibacter sp.]